MTIGTHTAASYLSALRCPSCRSPLLHEPDTYRCAACDRLFPIILGIPDFRLQPDPYISISDDRAKGLRIARECKARDLRGMLEYYWSITPEVEPQRAARFVESVIAGADRGRDILDWLERTNSRRGEPFLEIGCGAGASLPVALENFPSVAAVDRAFRWLVIAKLWLEEAGHKPMLVCANAEHLPFADDTFDLIIADNVIEHSNHGQIEIVREARRITAPRGVFFASTPNRFAPLPDPHYGVPLLGWLPRATMPGVVRALRGREYISIRLLSGGELRQLYRQAGFRKFRLSPAIIGAAQARRFRGLAGVALRVYQALSGWPVTRGLLRMIGPVLWGVGRK